MRIVVVFAEIIQGAFAAVPSELYKLRLIVRDQDFLRVKLVCAHRADWQAGGFYCFGIIIFILFIKYCGYVGKRGAACIFEVKRHILVIVLHALPLGGVKCIASVSAVITVKHCPAILSMAVSFL